MPNLYLPVGLWTIVKMRKSAADIPSRTTAPFPKNKNSILYCKWAACFYSKTEIIWQFSFLHPERKQNLPAKKSTYNGHSALSQTIKSFFGAGCSFYSALFKQRIILVLWGLQCLALQI